MRAHVSSIPRMLSLRHPSAPRWFAACTLIVLSACAAAQPQERFSQRSPTTSSNGTLTVAAASDLKAPFQTLAQRFEQQGYTVKLVFGSSGMLAEQIANGAPYDLFASANREFVEKLVAQGLIEAQTVAVYGYGYLALVISAQREAPSTLSLEYLLSPAVQRIAIAHPDHAPYGMLAREALTRAGYWDQIRPKLVYAENVFSAGQLAQSGEAEAGLVALAVAKALPEVRYTVITPKLYTPLAQTLGVVSNSANRAAALRFAELVLSPQGREVLRQSGIPASDDPPPTP